MKKLLISVIVIAISFSALAQQYNKVTIGTIDSIQSTILKEQRKIWVYVPESWPPGNKQRYPVLYLLDGEGHFYSVVGMIQQLSQVNGNTVCPEMIVVGITNTDRTRDLTPTKAAPNPPMIDSAMANGSGGGEAFVSFIEKELMPHIDSLYPTQPYKMLVGHSLGGLTVMNVLMNHTKLFNSYIAIDPSMWWDKKNLLLASKKKLIEMNFGGSNLYLGIANTMEPGMNITKVKTDTSMMTEHIRAILDLDKTIKAQTKNGLSYASKYYGDDDHGSVPMIATYDALHFFFKKYRFTISFKDFMDSAVDLAGKFEKHYQEVTKLLGYKVLPPEAMPSYIAYEALKQKQFAKAEALFKMNVKNYPDSPDANDAYGDYFVAIGNKEKAAEYFTKSLALKEDPERRKKLENVNK